MPDKTCPYCMERLHEGGSCPACGQDPENYRPPAHCLLPGTLLTDRYVIGGVLGEGGFGITYIGLDLRLDLRVAVKEFFPAGKAVRGAGDGKAVLPDGSVTARQEFEACKDRFLQEARRMARMEKLPEIVGVKDFFEENGTAYIVMEYIAGVTLKQLVAEQGPLDVERALTLFHPLFPALSALHESGLLHRDISPDNLILENGVLRLLDFGCAREVIPGDYTMTISLKHGFAPIEQYQSRSGGQGPWTDVYGLAATLYYCLCGKAPEHALDRLCKDRLAPPKAQGVALEERRERALMRGIALIPNRRFQSIAEFERALYGQEGRPKPRRKTAAAVIGGTAVLILLALLAVTTSPRWKADAISLPEISPVLPTSSFAESSSAVGAAVSLPSREELISAADGGDQSLWDENSLTVSTKEQFLAALADTSVPSVIVDTDSSLQLDVSDIASAVITKPVLVRRGILYAYTPVEVTGENALLCTTEDALLVINSYLRTSRGGRIYNGKDRTVSVNTPAVVESSADWLGGEYDNRGKLTLDESAIREQAEFPKSETELAAALESADTKAVILTEDMELAGSYCCSVPFIVEPSVTLTLSGDFTAPNGSFINYGSIHGTGHLQLEGQEGSVSLNYGEIALGGLSLVDHASLFNAGSIEKCQISAGPFTYFDNCGALGFDALPEGLHELAGGFWNCGPVNVYGSVSVNRMQDVLAAVQVHRGGVLRAAVGFSIESAELFVHAGGTFINETLFRSHDGAVHLEEGGVFQNDSPGSVVCNVYEYAHAFQDTGIGGIVRSCRSQKDTEGTLRISTEEELRKAQQGDPRELVILEAPVALSEDITILRDMRIEPGAKLLGNGVTVTLDGAHVSASGDGIEASHVALGGGAFLECTGLTITGSQGSLEVGLDGEATLYTDWITMNRAEIRTGSGAVVLVREINDGSAMTVGGRFYRTDALIRGDSGNFSVDDLEIANGLLYLVSETAMGNERPAHVRVGENGTLGLLGEASFSQGAMEIGETGRLLTGAYSLCSFDTEFQLTNRGEMTAQNIEVCPVTLRGSLINDGVLRMESEHPGFVLSGILDNQGTIIAKTSDPFQLDGSGALTGNQRIIAD